MTQEVKLDMIRNGIGVCESSDLAICEESLRIPKIGVWMYLREQSDDQWPSVSIQH